MSSGKVFVKRCWFYYAAFSDRNLFRTARAFTRERAVEKAAAMPPLRSRWERVK